MGFTEGGNTLFVQSGFDSHSAGNVPLYLKHQSPEWTRNAIIDDLAIATLVASRMITTDSLKYLHRSSVVVDLLMIVANQLIPELESRTQLSVNREYHTRVTEGIKLVAGTEYRSTDRYDTLPSSRRALIRNHNGADPHLLPATPSHLSTLSALSTRSTPSSLKPNLAPAGPSARATLETFAQEAFGSIPKQENPHEL